jgi:uncharacterized protein YecT (DUF1311 family)
MRNSHFVREQTTSRCGDIGRRIKGACLYRKILLAVGVSLLLAFDAVAQQRCYFLECTPGSNAPPPPPAAAPPPVSNTYPSAAIEQSAPRFNCARASGADEFAICGSSVLANLDQRLNSIFGSLLASLDSQQRTRLRSQQRSWLAQRAGCAGNATCIEAAYKARIAQLESWR